MALQTATPATQIMIASGNAAFRKAMLESLACPGQAAVEASGGADVLLQLDQARFGRLILDRQLPDLHLDEVVEMVRAQYPQIAVEIHDSAIAVGPVQRPQPAPAPEPYPEQVPMPRRPPRGAVAPVCEVLPGLVGASPQLIELAELVRLVAPRRTTVLVTGETGTGKEVVARAVHALSPRAARPWVVVNCAAIPEALLESELFGHAKGAFTGAGQARAGLIQAAHGGTLFLDEIGDMPLLLQAKLLRFLQEGELQRLGTNERQRVDVRVIAATNANLMQRVREGAFRSDLYYRLSVFPLEVAPLRDRPADIVPIAEHTLRGAGDPEEAATLSPEAVRLLESHAWPGNVRELLHCIERSRILAGDGCAIGPQHFPALLAPGLARAATGSQRA